MYHFRGILLSNHYFFNCKKWNFVTVRYMGNSIYPRSGNGEHCIYSLQFFLQRRGEPEPNDLVKSKENFHFNFLKTKSSGDI